MLKIRYSNQFKKDYKLIKKRGYNIDLLKQVVQLLSEKKPLPEKYKDHILLVIINGFKECHIQPDWLLIYKVENDELTLTVLRTGTHSDLF